MVKIRLRRVGAKKKPSYRVVVTDSQASRNGKFIEIVGNYCPLTNPATIVMDKDKILMWLGRGAQPTERVAKLISSAGVMEQPQRRGGPQTKNSADKPPAVNAPMNAKERG